MPPVGRLEFGTIGRVGTLIGQMRKPRAEFMRLVNIASKSLAEPSLVLSQAPAVQLV